LANSELRKYHKPRPELTANVLNSVNDEGETKAGIVIDGTRIWSIFEPMLGIYDLQESTDVSPALSSS
jgi:hypothetical protein